MVVASTLQFECSRLTQFDNSEQPTISNMDTILMITVSQDDLNEIKGQEICNTTQDCYIISHGDELIADTLGNVATERDILMIL